MAAQKKANVKYEIALKIRELLDAAKKEYGATEWNDDEMESKIVELITEE